MTDQTELRVFKCQMVMTSKVVAKFCLQVRLQNSNSIITTKTPTQPNVHQAHRYRVHSPVVCVHMVYARFVISITYVAFHAFCLPIAVSILTSILHNIINACINKRIFAWTYNRRRIHTWTYNRLANASHSASRLDSLSGNVHQNLCKSRFQLL